MIKKSCHYFLKVCFVIITILVFFQVMEIFERKTSIERMDDFITNELETDILFLGTSQVAADIMPMELWQRYGYTSYVACAPKDGIRRNVAMLQLVLEYSNPQLVVLNVDRYWREDDVEEQVAGYHIFADAFPLTAKKIETTKVAFEDNDAINEILFPFIMYHDRWKELTEDDFIPQKEQEKALTKGGTESDSVSDGISQYEKISSDDAEIPEGIGAKEIKEMIQICKEKGIEVILVAFPLEADEEQQRYFNGLQQIADDFQIPYLNFIADSSMVNPETDYEDGAHLNVSGARKMTKYIGSYIQENYEIPNRMLEEKYVQQWSNDYAEYCSYKNDRIKNAEELQKILVLGKDENLNHVLYIEGSSACYRDEKTISLLRNLAPFSKLDQAIAEERDFLAVVDYGTGQVHEFLNPAETKLETSFGELTFCMDDEGKPDLRINNSLENNFVYDERGDIFISFFDCINKENICTKVFKTKRKLVAEPRIKE